MVRPCAAYLLLFSCLLSVAGCGRSRGTIGRGSGRTADASTSDSTDTVTPANGRTCAHLSPPIQWPDGIGMLCVDRDDGSVSRLDLHANRVRWRRPRPRGVTWQPFVATHSQ